MDEAELEMEDFIEKYLATGIDVISDSNTDTTNTSPVKSEAVVVTDYNVNSNVKTVIEVGKQRDNTTSEIPSDNFEYKSRKFVSNYSPTSDNLRRRPLATHPWCAEEEAEPEITGKSKDSNARLSGRNKCMFAFVILVNVAAVYVICNHVQCENVKNIFTGGLHENVIVNWITNRFPITQKHDASRNAKSEHINSSSESVEKGKDSTHKESASAKKAKVETPTPEVETPALEVETPSSEVNTPEVKASVTEKQTTTKKSVDTAKKRKNVPPPPSPSKSK